MRLTRVTIIPSFVKREELGMWGMSEFDKTREDTPEGGVEVGG